MIPIPKNMGFDKRIKYIACSLFSTKVTITLIVDFVLDLQIPDRSEATFRSLRHSHSDSLEYPD